MGKDVQLVKVDSATPDPARVKSLDVIFIHGLGGDHVETWKPPSGDTWPQRVANTHPDVQVWSLSYPAKVGELLSIGDMDQPGTRGLAVLATERMVNKKIAEKRPCIFVCHSLGGLLAKRILLDAWSADQRDARRFRHEGVKAVMFCGTPHRGSAIANVLKGMEWVKNIAPGLVMTYLGWDYSRYAGWFARRIGQTSDLIKELEQNNVDLRHLNEDFGRYYQQRAGGDFMVTVYAETKGVKLKGIPTAVVVPAESADPNLRTGAGPRLQVMPVPDRDHSELVKPASDSEWVIEGLDDLVGRVRESVVGDRETEAVVDTPPLSVPSDMRPQNHVESDDAPAMQAIEVSSPTRDDPHPPVDASETGRQIFISYAANDPEWTQEKVEQLAVLIQSKGVTVRLDVWHERDFLRGLSIEEWRSWMSQSLSLSTNVMCLVSKRYGKLWRREEEDEGGLGVAYEAIRLVHALYLRKQHNRGWILTLRLDGTGFDVIPDDLAIDCVHYCWNKHCDRVISHLTKADTAITIGRGKAPEVKTREDAPGAAASVKLDRNMLMHQASHAIKSLQRASAYWTALQTSENLNDLLTAERLVSPKVFVESLPLLSSEKKTSVMSELRAVFQDEKNDLVEKELEAAAAATVACFLFCTCSLIEASAGDAMIALPNVRDRNAAHLLASLIALVMVGGRLELRHGDGVLPRGSGTYRVQSTGVNTQFDFERQLYADLVRNPWSVSAGQKTGGLSDEERDELLGVLRDLRGIGVRTKAMCFIVDGDESPDCGVDVACEIGVPVFHAGAKVTEVIFGVSEATLVTHLKHLWADVSAYQSTDAADATPP